MSLDITVYSEYEYGVASLKGAWFVQWTTSRLERVEGHTTEGTDKQTKIGLLVLGACEEQHGAKKKPPASSLNRS